MRGEQIGDAVTYVGENGLCHSAVITALGNDSRVSLNVVLQSEEATQGYYDRRVRHMAGVPRQAGRDDFGAWRPM